MAQAQTTSSSQFSSQKNFSNKVHERVLKATQEITEALDKFEFKNNGDEKYFFREVNHYYQDLTATIFHLRKIIIIIGDKNQSGRDLQDVVKNLNKLASLIQEYLNLQANEIKTPLKKDMVKIGAEVEQLLKIIEYDDLHEYKQKVVDCQHDLALCVEKLKLYNQFHYLSIAGMESLMHEFVDKLKANLIILKTSNNQISEEDFSHYVRHSMQISHNTINYMRRSRNIGNFKGDLENFFKKTEDFADSFIGDVKRAAKYDNPVNKMLDIIDNCHKNITSGLSTLEEGVKKMNSANPGENEMEIIQFLIPYLLISALHGIICLNQSIEDAIIKND